MKKINYERIIEKYDEAIHRAHILLDDYKIEIRDWTSDINEANQLVVTKHLTCTLIKPTLLLSLTFDQHEDGLYKFVYRLTSSSTVPFNGTVGNLINDINMHTKHIRATVCEDIVNNYLVFESVFFHKAIEEGILHLKVFLLELFNETINPIFVELVNSFTY